jgi:hypothetical protein
VGVDEVGDRVEAVERAGVHVAGLGGDDRGSLEPFEGPAQRGDLEAVLVVARHLHRGALTEPEVAQGPGHGRVSAGLEHHVHLRGAGQPVRLDVPAHLPEHVVTGRREAGEVRHLPAGDEPDRAARRQADELDDPACRHLLDDRDAGGRAYNPAFWSQVETSSSVPYAAGCRPPITNPK